MSWQNCGLRDLEERDLEKVLEWRNSDKVRTNMYQDHIITWDEHRAWFKTQKNNSNVIYRIFEFQSNPVGMVYFTDIDEVNGKCRWGFYLGEVNLPRGLGLTMGFLGVEYTFKKIGVRKLCSEAFAFNLSSINFHKKLGFKEEGRFLEHILKNGRHEDIIFFALFNRDWQVIKKELKLMN